MPEKPPPPTASAAMPLADELERLQRRYSDEPTTARWAELANTAVPRMPTIIAVLRAAAGRAADADSDDEMTPNRLGYLAKLALRLDPVPWSKWMERCEYDDAYAVVTAMPRVAAMAMVVARGQAVRPAAPALTAEQLEVFRKLLIRWGDESDTDAFGQGRRFGLQTAAVQAAFILRRGFDSLVANAVAASGPAAQEAP